MIMCNQGGCWWRVWALYPRVQISPRDRQPPPQIRSHQPRRAQGKNLFFFFFLFLYFNEHYYYLANEKRAVLMQIFKKVFDALFLINSNQPTSPGVLYINVSLVGYEDEIIFTLNCLFYLYIPIFSLRRRASVVLPRSGGCVPPCPRTTARTTPPPVRARLPLQAPANPPSLAVRARPVRSPTIRRSRSAGSLHTTNQLKTRERIISRSV